MLDNISLSFSAMSEVPTQQTIGETQPGDGFQQPGLKILARPSNFMIENLIIFAGAEMRLRRAILALSFPLAFLSFLLVTTGSQAANANNKHVVVISIDGFGWEQYWQNPKVKMPTVRKLAAEGSVGPMEVAFPSVTWVSHVSMVTGAFPRETGVLGNSVFNRDLGITQNFIGDDVFDKDQLLKVDTIYDVLKKHDKSLKTAAISWPLTRGSKNLDYVVPESYSQPTYVAFTRPSGFLRELWDKAIPVDRWGDWSALPVSYRQDWLTAEAAKHLIETQKPNLLFMHFLVADSFSHLYGSGSAEGIWAHEYIDGLIGSVVDKLKAEKMWDDTTLFIVSDHGFTNVSKSIKPNVVLKLDGFIRTDKNGIVTEKEAIAVMNHGVGFVYVLGEDKSGIISKIKPRLAKLEGIKSVYEGNEFDRLGFPTAEHNPHAPDLLLVADRDYMIIDDIEGIDPIGAAKYAATHGHDPRESWMRGSLIVRGPGIKENAALSEVTIRDIAPTIAGIFGAKMPTTWPGRGGKYRQGRELRELNAQ